MESETKEKWGIFECGCGFEGLNKIFIAIC
jgi:hypothetical protein